MNAPRAAQPGLRWGIKRSFLRYIARMPDGACSVTDGADPVDESAFRFESAGDLRFRGDVRFSGHHGLLFVRIADPELLVDGTRGTLTVAGDPRDPDGPERVPLVTFELTDAGDGTTNGTVVRLTPHGAELFNSVYPAGEPFDDFTIHPERGDLR